MNIERNIGAGARQALAFLIGTAIFGLFIAFLGKNPFAIYSDLLLGSVGTKFSIQNTVTRAIPLMLTALCTLIPMHVGMVIIGNEGALLMGGLAAVGSGVLFASLPPVLGIPLMMLAGFAAGGAWIGICAWAKSRKGVDPTISSLLMFYIGLGLFLYLVEGPMRNPLSLNKPSTYSIPDGFRIGEFLGTGVHWGLAIALIAALAAYFLIFWTPLGFSMRISGGNPRTARLLGLSERRLLYMAAFLGGGSAGLAGMIEVAAIHTNANASLNAGLGFGGILVAFAARQNPLGIIPVSLLIGGIQAAGGILQRRHDLSDATVDVYQGILFIVILCADLLAPEGFLKKFFGKKPEKQKLEASVESGQVESPVGIEPDTDASKEAVNG